MRLFEPKHHVSTDKSGPRFRLDLHHKNESVVTIENVSEEDLSFVKGNIGRDKIFITERLAVNLRDFHVVEAFDPKHEG